MKLFNAVTGANVVLYRLSGGRLGSSPVLLLDHTGRKSGRRRTTPVLYIQDGDDLVVVGSRVGSDFDPALWLNLKANPATTVQVRQRRQVVARQATTEEKERPWPRLVDAYPDYAVHQRRTEREIPVIVLSLGVGAPPLSETSSAAERPAALTPGFRWSSLSGSVRDGDWAVAGERIGGWLLHKDANNRCARSGGRKRRNRGPHLRARPSD